MNDSPPETIGQRTRFEYCISLIVLTLRRESDVIIIPAGQSPFIPALPYNLITLTLGWWGVPWGIILTPLILWRNLCGGRDVFDEGCTPDHRGPWA